jgi:hypothetical protein
VFSERSIRNERYEVPKRLVFVEKLEGMACETTEVVL